MADGHWPCRNLRRGIAALAQDRNAAIKYFSAAAPMARAVIEAAPDRIIWGSDYPHLSFADKVGSVELFNLLAQWVPDAAAQKRSW